MATQCSVDAKHPFWTAIARHPGFRTPRFSLVEVARHCGNVLRHRLHKGPFYLLFALIAWCAQCTAEVRGILVARFDDGQHFAPKRISTPSAGTDKELRITVSSRKRSCEMNLALPPNAGGCEPFIGLGLLSCSDGRRFDLEWTMTSCHSGFGRSSGDGEPLFAFGFSGDVEGALDQLESARAAGDLRSRTKSEQTESDAGTDTLRAPDTAAQR